MKHYKQIRYEKDHPCYVASNISYSLILEPGLFKPMSKYLRSQQKVNKRVVQAAINALKKKGWDINPYTVAEEAKVARSFVYRSPEAMDLLVQARGDNHGDPQARIAVLEEHVRELEDVLCKLEEENRKLQLELAKGSLIEQNEKQDQSLDSDAGSLKGQPVIGLSEKGDDLLNQPKEHSQMEIHRTPGHADSSRLISDQSWKDLQTVYSYSGDLFKDYVKDLSFSGRTADLSKLEPSNTDRGGEAGLSEAILDSSPASRQADEIDTDSSKESKRSLKVDPRTQAAQVLAEAQALAEAQVRALAEAEERVRAQADAQMRQEERKVSGQDESKNTGEGNTREGKVDLDKLDIFEGLENADLRAIEAIQDIELEQVVFADDPGDELRELLKSRIKQACELKEQVIDEPLPPPKRSEPQRPLPRSKFVGSAKVPQEPPSRGFIIRQVPPDIRKACLILGVRPETLTQATVLQAWKRQIASPGVHPDLGGDTEAAVFLNTAKDQLVRWLDAHAPKLGKRFGSNKSKL